MQMLQMMGAQLGIGQSFTLTSQSAAGVFKYHPVPPGVYKIRQIGGGGGGASQYYGYSYEQESGEPGEDEEFTTYLTNATDNNQTVGAGGSPDFAGGNTLSRQPGTTSTSGGDRGETKTSPQTGKSPPKGGVDFPTYERYTFDGGALYWLGSARGQSGRGYNSSDGAATAGKPGAIRYERIA